MGVFLSFDESVSTVSRALGGPSKLPNIAVAPGVALWCSSLSSF